MKESTIVWAKFESKGYPDKTMTMQGTTKEIAIAWFKWTLESGVYLASRMIMTIARTEAELDATSNQAAADDLSDELDAILNRQAELEV